MRLTIKFLSLILFLTYSSYVFRIVFPLVDYAVNHNYIIEELCVQKEIENNSCQGKCHLSKQIQKQVENPTKEKGIILIDFIKIPHLNADLVESICLFNSQNNLKKIIVMQEIKMSSKPLLPPPKKI